MNTATFIRALDHAEVRLLGYAPVPEAQAERDRWPRERVLLQHARWMIGQIRGFVAEEETEKAGRWLGFVQGVLWVSGLASIEEMREVNRGTD